MNALARLALGGLSGCVRVPSAAGAPRLAAASDVGVWTRLDSTLVPGEDGWPDVRVDARSVEGTDSTIVFTSVPRAVSPEEAGALLAQRQTLPKPVSTARLDARGDTLAWVDAEGRPFGGRSMRASPAPTPAGLAAR